MSCGGACCCRTESTTPRPIGNRPGLDALAYRVGDHASFFATMRARLSSSAHPSLGGLTTHDVADPSVALLDAWAVVADVLTFYQERIASEGYLRTATERRSVVEQARLVGYRPRPGVASSLYLAYTIDPNSGPVEVPAGARANSVPGPGEQMQAFETSEPLEARAEWNELRVRMSQPQSVSSIVADGLFLKGVDTGLAVNDALLVDFGLGLGTGPEPMLVSAVHPDPEHDRTKVLLQDWNGQDLVVRLVEVTVRALADVEHFGVDRSSATAVKMLKVLGGIAAPGTGIGRAEVLSNLDLARAAVVAEWENAQLHDWTKLAGWLGEAAAQLDGLRALASGVDSVVTLRRRGAVAAHGKEDDGFVELLDRLDATPSIPPRNSRRLQRSPSTTFAPSSDVYPALLSSIKPHLRPVLYTALANSAATAPSAIAVFALRQKASLFGANAPREPEYDDSGKLSPQPWDDWSPDPDEDPKLLHLDRVHPAVVAGGRVFVVRPTTDTFGPLLASAVSVREESRSAYGLTGSITTVELDAPWWDPSKSSEDDLERMDVLRATRVHCQSEPLELAEAPVEDDVCGELVELDRLYDGLHTGRWMVLSGERVDVPGTSGVRASELVMLAGVSQRVATVAGTDPDGTASEQPLAGDVLHTFVTFAKPLSYCYRRGSVVLNANVVHATHGERRTEVLGGGDATQSLQTFTLKQAPVTYVSAPSVTGVSSSLGIRVNGVAWHEVDNTLASGPTSRTFLTGRNPDGSTWVTFGNGRQGSRLPTGVENVQADYRSGLGEAGNVVAEQVSLLATTPLGVKGVINPVRASGGADPEGRDQIRRNAPLAMMALDRLVSTQDYADFARTFAGVAKASADRLSDGGRRVVVVTIAGVDDVPIDVTSDLYRNLLAAIRRFGDPHLPVRLAVRDLVAIVVSANIRVLPDYEWDLVEPHLRARMLEVFGFERRELGQDVTSSEVLATLQGVPGVDYVDLDLMRGLDEAEVVKRLTAQAAAGRVGPSNSVVGHGVNDGGPSRTPGIRGLASRPGIVVWPARVINGAIKQAQLAYLLPGISDSLILNEVQT